MIIDESIEMTGLLSRDEFREGVFTRDHHKCVICREPAQDAHHIIERRLWKDGGYYLENGASLCGSCHIHAEETKLTCEDIRRRAGIDKVILPEHLYRDAVYDKWGNIVQPNGTRIRGELFGDESVQKILRQGGVLDLFQPFVKYPRTFHLPWSEGMTDDDRMMNDPDAAFGGKEIVITEKMDGENTSMYRDHIHARSLDSGSHPSRGWVKNLHAQICHDIPEGWRICGENLYARHTLPYGDLSSFFMVFSIWNESNLCLSWDDTVTFSTLLGLEHVPVLYRGAYSIDAIQSAQRSLDLSKQEGYVVRIADAFQYGAFRRSIAKFVRKAHVGTAHNWMMQVVVPNGMKKA